MSWLTKVVSVAVLALWGLATLHCDLERVPGFEFLAWCHQEVAPPDNGDCGSDACAELESALYKAEQQGVTIPVPALTASFLVPLSEVIFATIEPNPVLPNSSPPELPRFWQFSYRTALPPRAPSATAS